MDDPTVIAAYPMGIGVWATVLCIGVVAYLYYYEFRKHRDDGGLL